MSSTVVVALLRIGDLIQCFPAVSDLKRAFQQDDLILMVQKGMASLAELHPSVDRVIEFDGDEILKALRWKEEWVKQGFR